MRQRWTAAGMVRIEAQLLPDEAALFMKALAAAGVACGDGADAVVASEDVPAGTSRDDGGPAGRVAALPTPEGHDGGLPASSARAASPDDPASADDPASPDD